MSTGEIKVLLVDDDEEELVLVRAMLGKVEHLKYSIDWCADPKEAVEKIVLGKHDVCLVDYNLGVTTGLDLIRETKDRGCNGMPIILMTGQGNHEIDMEAMKLGAADYLNKGPLKKEILERSIRYSIERKKAEEKLREMSLKDGLTGLANRRYFDEVLDRELRRARREGIMLSLVLIDIDYFKLYNDRYGHIEGDKCLQQVCKLINQFANRPGDLAARYGGEEMALILPETDSKGAYKIAEEMRKQIEDFNIPHEGSKIDGCEKVTISVGVTSLLPDKNSKPSILVHSADKAMYEAKSKGRNRVER